MNERFLAKTMRVSILLLSVAAVLSGCASTKPNSGHPADSSETDPEVTQLVADLVAAGDADFKAGRIEPAIILYLEASKHQPSPDLWARLGYAYSQQKQWAPAATAYSKLVELDPDRSQAWEALGQIYLNQRQTGKAATYFARAVEIDPDLWRAHNGLGVAADVRGDFEKASFHYRRALALNDASPMVWTNYGYSLYLRGAFHGARSSFQQALELDQSYTPAWTNLGLVAARLKDYDQALSVLSKTQELPKAYNDTGYIAMLNEDWEVAEHLLRRATELSPTYYVNAHDNLKRLKVEMDKAAVRELDSKSSGATKAELGMDTSSAAAASRHPQLDWN